MRILHVLESFAPGGMETAFLNVLRAWRAESPWATHEVLAMAGGPLEDVYRLAADAVIVTSVQEDLERAVIRPCDAIHFLFERCAYRLMPHAIAHGHAAVVYGKGYDMGGMFRLNDGFRWQPDESLLWGADAATFTTDALARGFDGPPSRETVLGKAADIRRFLALPPAGPTTPRRIVCVANLHARKRLGDLVAAVAALRPTLPDVTVRFVGRDNTHETARLRCLARDAGAEDACEFTGLLDDVAPALTDARVFALPSGNEGVPTAMLEAMAAARPVVMTDVGHISTVVTDGVEGFLVAPGDVAAMTERLRAMLCDDARAERMGLAARQRVTEHDVRAVAGRLRRVLEGAAKGNVRLEAAA